MDLLAREPVHRGELLADRGGQFSDRTEKGVGWGKLEKYEPTSARIARAHGWDSRRIPEQVAGKLKYTRSFVNGMERSHGRPQRALELVRRELDRHGNPRARPPGMVDTQVSRDENERAERDAARASHAARLKNNLRTFTSADGRTTVADAMLMQPSYLVRSHAQSLCHNLIGGRDDAWLSRHAA